MRTLGNIVAETEILQVAAWWFVPAATVTVMTADPELIPLIVKVEPLSVTSATSGALLAAIIVPLPERLTLTVVVFPTAPMTLTVDVPTLTDPAAFAIVHDLAIEPTYAPIPVIIRV